MVALGRYATSSALLFGLVLLASAGCGDDDPPFGPWYGVGGACRGDRDCPSRCEEGYCTVACEFDGHCSPGTACVNEHGGICAPVCNGGQCGPGYQCRPTDRRGADGSIPVCRR